MTLTEPDEEHQTLPPELRAFGDFELLNEIAQGGMGVVYRARQISLNRIVALKMILAGEFASSEFVRRFRNEAEAVARLRHPNIVTIYEVGEHEGLPYFAMEFVEGPSFRELIRDGPLQARRAAGYLRSIACAVAHAHEHQVLHRDLKPSNILLDPFDQPRVTDFGLARQLDVDTDLTLSGQIIGSPGYMPPEQALGRHAQIGPASDIYALGAVLYHLLTGRPPFQADTVHAVLLQVQTLEPVPLRRLNPSVPPDLETICLRCLEKEPAKRLASAQDLAEELSRFLRDEPIQSRPISLLEKNWRRCRRRPTVAALSGALILALIAGGWGVLRQTRQADLARVIASTTTEQSRMHQYSTDMRAAWEAVERGLFSDARTLLEKHRSKAGQPDERGFEWRFLWRRSQGQQLAILTNHTGTVCGVAVSPDGHWAASAGMDAQLCLWDLDQLKPHAQWPLGGVGWFVDFSADGALLFSSKGADHSAIWRVPNGELVGQVPGSRAAIARTAPILAGLSLNPFISSRPAPIRVSNYQTGECLTNLPTLGRAVAVSPNGQLIAVGLAKSNIVVHDLVSGRGLVTLATKTEAFSLSFSPDGTRLAAGGWNKALQLWVLGAWVGGNETNKPSAPREQTLLTPMPIAIHSPTRASTPLEEGHWLKTWAVAFSPDGRRLASTSSDRSVRVWDANTLAPLEMFNGHGDEVWCVAWTPDGQRLITGGKDGLVMVWQTGLSRVELALPNYPWQRPCFTPDGTALLTHPKEGSAAAWSTQGARLDDWPDSLSLIGFAADGAAGLEFDAAHGALNYWPIKGKEPSRSLALEHWQKNARARDHGTGLSPGGNYFFVLQTNGLAQVWETSNGRLRAQFPTRPSWVACARLSPDGGLFCYSVETPYEAYLYDVGTGHARVLTGHTEYVKSLAFSSDSRFVATAGIDGRIKIWETSTGREVQTLPGHWQGVDDVAFAPDGRTLASVESRAEVKLWRLDTYREVASIPMPDVGESLTFSPAGDRLAVVHRDQTVRFLEAPEVP